MDKNVLNEENVSLEDGVILEVRNLKKHFVLKKTLMGKPLSTLKAVDDVSFTIKEGETLGIVGESGCGKTTMGRTVLKLHQPSGGQIIFEGKDITNYTPKQMRALRTKMQIVFQDPYSSLPPRSTVGDILSEPVRVHNIVPPDQVKDYVLNIMEQCGLRDYYYERYPHEFSGGQRQRICIARALAVAPKLVICDEPVSVFTLLGGKLTLALCVLEQLPHIKGGNDSLFSFFSAVGKLSALHHFGKFLLHFGKLFGRKPHFAHKSTKQIIDGKSKFLRAGHTDSLVDTFAVFKLCHKNNGRSFMTFCTHYHLLFPHNY